MAMAQFPLPLACVPPAFAPAWHDFADSLADGTSTFFFGEAPAAAHLLTALRTPVTLAAAAEVDLVQDVVGSGRLAPAALARLRAAAAGGAPWWLVVRNLQGVDSPTRAVHGGNLLMMLLERRAGARYEGLDLSRCTALLLAEDGSSLRALQGRWSALAAQAQPARGQTPLNPEALFARVAKGHWPRASGGSGGGSAEWSAALHSPGCRGARRGGGGGGSGSGGGAGGGSGGGSLQAAALYAGVALLAALAVLVLYVLWGRHAATASKGTSSGGSGGKGGSPKGAAPAKQRGKSQSRGGARA
jgi:hypothetical protein